MQTFKIGDKIRGNDVYSFDGKQWMHIYEILDIEMATRFEKLTPLLTVKIVTTDGTVVDEKTKRWPSQLF